MSRHRLDVVVLAAAAALTLGSLAPADADPAVATTPAATADSSWRLLHDVDLSDPRAWTLERGQARNNLAYDLPQNVSFGAAGLTIRGQRELAPNGAAYTAGDAKGYGIAIPNYARVEAIGTAPHEVGMWPAVMWMRPLGYPDGEIDLIENLGGQPRAHATLHNEYGDGHRTIHGLVPWADLADPDPTVSHRYVMEKTPQRIRIQVDGVTMLDADPSDAPVGFHWGRIFENPEREWYPRVTLQIGCNDSFQPGCGVGLPRPAWSAASMTLSSLKVWTWDPPSTADRSGVFELAPGRRSKVVVTTATPSTAKAVGSFKVPGRLTADGTLQGSVQVRSSADARTGYRARARIRRDGDLHLQVIRLRDGHRRVLTTGRVPGRYAAGDRVQVRVAEAKGVVRAKAWVAGTTEPAWQQRATDASPLARSPRTAVATALSGTAGRTVTVPYRVSVGH